MNYGEAVRWLYGTQLHGIKLGLENIRRLLLALDVPADGSRGPRFLHVAGTNGKGSVCAMLERICRAAGHRTGLFTSPHLVSFRERIQIAGEAISEEAVAAGLTRLRALTAEWEHAPTFFELTTALALAYFQDKAVDLVILETGLGGRLDATNAVTPLVSIFTTIDLDHQQWLGETCAAIAMEKAGIIKDGIPAISLPQHEEVQTVLTQIAAQREAPFSLVISPLLGMEMGLLGSHQRWNAALAVHALDAAGLALPESALLEGLRDVEWPGRFHEVEGCILDGAHNPAAALRLAETWREEYGDAKATLVLGILGDKDAAGICAALAPIAAQVLAVPVRNPRALPPEAVQAAMSKAAPEISCTCTDSVTAALTLATASGHRPLIAGSLFLVGEALAALTGLVPETSTQ